MRLNKRTGNKSLVSARGIFSLTGNAATLTKTSIGGNYPAVVTSLGIEHVYDFQTSGTGCQTADGSLLTPSQAALNSAYGVGNVTFDNTNKRVVLTGTYSGTRKTFEGWDLRGIQFYLEVIQKGWTVKNCKVGPSKDSTNTLNNQNYPIKVSNTNAAATAGDANSNVIIEYNTIDGYDSGTNTYHGSAAIIVAGSGSTKINGVIIRNNTIRRMGQDNINARGNDIEIYNNYMTAGGLQTGAHADMLQFWDGNNLRYHHNFIDSIPVIIDDPNNIGTHGRTGACFLECFPSNTSINDALIEFNYIPGCDLLDVDNVPQYFTFLTALNAGTGSTGTTMSNNRFNNNAVSFGLGIMNTGSRFCSGTGNRKISDNSLIADFTFS